ncbi:uncharacterized protein MCYG_08190 [Microsporum canis CBS 113480]|uniref:Uncharacterized protein n=1 Tax=Arthroderma otae (strain ATCC MYA-4605 / CBS 113480) TaxID=554155 RepID=C5FZR8_ARTOC|nr:uncharacterized protein MCYG_08190 [Microsporum canis CBS 113480]EEQ35371.1 predicted protein [Microsporum canis CBS 113480]
MIAYQIFSFQGSSSNGDDSTGGLFHMDVERESVSGYEDGRDTEWRNLGVGRHEDVQCLTHGCVEVEMAVKPGKKKSTIEIQGVVGSGTEPALLNAFIIGEV